MKIELRDHQKDAVDKIHNGCVLCGGVGTGKTITSLAYAKAYEAGKTIVVITTAKKRDSGDWEKEAMMLQIHPDDIEVTSWNKIRDYEDWDDQFFIFDEQRLVGSGAWVKSFYKIAKKNHWILLSGTPGDTWADYGPMFIANGWYKNISEFRAEHAIYSRYAKFPKIERWVGEAKLRRYRDALLVDMPMLRHTVRHIHQVECEYDSDKLDLVRKKRWNVYEDKPIKNAAELFGVMRKVVSTDPSRTEALRSLINTHPKLIVFYNYNYELEIMRNLLGSMTPVHILEDDLIQPRQSDSLSTTLASLRPDNTTAIGDLLGLYTPTPTLLMNGETIVNPYSSTSQEMNAPTSLILPEERTSFGWAEWNGHKHQPIPDTDRWVYLVQYTSGSEGWNCIETDAMAFWSLTYSWKQYSQAQGRIDRMNTPFVDLNYYVLMADSPAEKPVIRSLDKKEDFQPR